MLLIGYALFILEGLSSTATLKANLTWEYLVNKFNKLVLL